MTRGADNCVLASRQLLFADPLSNKIFKKSLFTHLHVDPNVCAVVFPVKQKCQIKFISYLQGI